MSYKERYQQAAKAKALEKLNPEFITFDKSGDMIIGKYIDRHEVPGQKDEKGYFQYLFMTDNGPIKFHLGSVADGEIGVQLVKGNVYCLKFNGKEVLPNKRTVNKFDAFEVPEMPPEEKDGEKDG